MSVRIIAGALLLVALTVSAEDVETPANADPWESVNRKVFVFNDQVDTYLLKPVAKGYDWITPKMVNRGITNVLSTIGEIPSAGNSLLQGRFQDSGIALARFSINATMGLFGIFDLATLWGIEGQKEDFGQTLAVWGVPAGPYLVLPFFGPSNIRDTGGLAVDIYTNPLDLHEAQIDDRESGVIWSVRIVDRRADLMQFEELIQGDRYIFLRNAYLQQRNYEINNGVVEDNFNEEEYENDDWMEESGE